MNRLRRYWKTNGPFRKLSDLLFGVAVALSVFALVQTALLKRTLPPGVCPIQHNRPLIYWAIALLGISFILSFFGKRR